MVLVFLPDLFYLLLQHFKNGTSAKKIEKHGFSKEEGEETESHQGSGKFPYDKPQRNSGNLTFPKSPDTDN